MACSVAFCRKQSDIIYNTEHFKGELCNDHHDKHAQGETLKLSGGGEL